MEDQITDNRPTIRIADTTRLPASIAEEHRGVTVTVVVHEHEQLAEPVLKAPDITARPLLDHGHRLLSDTVVGDGGAVVGGDLGW